MNKWDAVCGMGDPERARAKIIGVANQAKDACMLEGSLSEIHSALRELNHIASVLEDELCHLTTILDPVLRPSSPQECGKERLNPVRSPLADELHCLAARFSARREQISDIKGRIDL